MSGLTRPEPSRWRQQVHAVPPAAAPAGDPEGAPLTSADQVRYLVATAGRVPSVHNSQPWWFRLAGPAIELHADPPPVVFRLPTRAAGKC